MANTRKLVAALAGTATAVTVLALAGTTAVDHRATRVLAEPELDQRTLLTAEHVRAVIRTGIMLLGRAADFLAGRDLGAVRNSRADRDALRAMLKDAGGVDSLWICDADRRAAVHQLAHLGA